MRTGRTSSLLASLWLLNSGFSAAAHGAVETDLFSLDLEQLLQIKVSTVSRREETIARAPATVTVLTAADIRRFGGNTLSDVLRRLPGATPLSSSILPDNLTDIRGQHSVAQDRHILLLLNGRPFRLGAGNMTHNLYTALPLSAVARIEYLRGPGSVVYGTNAVAGVINVITRDADCSASLASQVEFAAGSFASERLQAGVSTCVESTSVVVDGQHRASDGWSFAGEDLDGTASQQDMASSDDGLVASGRWRDFSATAFWSDSSHQVFSGVPRWPMIERELQQQFADLGYQTELAEWTVSAHFASNALATRSSSLDLDADSQDLEGLASRALADDGHLLFGFAQTDVSAEQWSRAGSITAYSTGEDRWQRLFAELALPLSEQWRTVLGGAQDRTDTFDWESTWRAALIGNWHNGWGLKLLWGESFRSANLNELYFNTAALRGNAALTPERGVNREFNLRWQGQQTEVALSVFDGRIDDVIITQAVAPGVRAFSNAGVLTSQGAELEARWQPVADWWWQAALTRQSSENESGMAEAQEMPEWQGKLGLAWQPPSGLVAGIYWHYYSKAPVYQPAPGVTAMVNPDAEAWSDLTLQLTVPLQLWFGTSWQAWQLGVYGDNLLELNAVFLPDVSFTTINTLPLQPGRSIMATLTARF